MTAPLRLEVLRHLGIDIFEHGGGIEPRALGHRAVLLRLLPRHLHFCLQFFFEALVLLLGPVTYRDQVLLQALNRIAQRERRPIHRLGGTSSGRRWSNVRRRDT